MKIYDTFFIAFDEGFAHAFAYMETWSGVFDEALNGRYEAARAALNKALAETDGERRRHYLAVADTGDYGR